MSSLRSSKKSVLLRAPDISPFKGDSNEPYRVFLDQIQMNPDKPWVDDIFPPNDKSLLALDELGSPIDPLETKRKINVSEIEWKRAHEIFPQPYLFENEICVDDIKQGKIGNCYFMSTIAALCEFPGLISKIFLTKEYNPNGIYKVVLFIDGEFQIVYLDDYFPCIKGTNIPYFAKPNSFELWALLLEKAWAKINGGYANIISGFPCDVFRTFTGFPCETINHKEENIDRVWGIISTVDNNYGLICTSTKDDKEIEKTGLVSAHTYTLIDTEEIEDDKKRLIRLCKLRNPWGSSDWNGDWCESSKLWTEKTRSQIEESDLALNSGEFFISIEDLCKYFSRTDLCQAIYNGYSKTFDFSQGELIEPQVFNIYVPTRGLFSVSAIEKNWRFNRELRNVSHPTSLILAEYDPDKKIIKHSFCDYESYQDVEKSRLLNPGYYILWIYKGLAISEKPLPELMKVRFISEPQVSIKLLGPDKNFQIIQNIIYLGVKHQRGKAIKDDEIFYEIKNEFGRSGLSYRIVINPLKTVYQKWEIDASEMSGISFLPPYSNQEKFSFCINPNNFGVIIGIRKQKFGRFWFNLKSEAEQFDCREGEEPFEVQRPEFDSFCLKDVDKEEPISGEKIPSLEELSKKEKYPVVDHSKSFAEKLYANYPQVMDILLKMKPQEGSKNLGWVTLKKDNGIYLGEADYNIPQGRGFFFFKKEQQTFIGYFDKGKKGNYGKLFDKNKKLVYEGEYENEVRNGKGVYYYPEGQRYEGDFVNGLREGNGTFYWEDGTYWEGPFQKNEMNGEGTYCDGNDKWPVTYKEGELIE